MCAHLLQQKWVVCFVCAICVYVCTSKFVKHRWRSRIPFQKQKYNELLLHNDRYTIKMGYCMLLCHQNVSLYQNDVNVLTTAPSFTILLKNLVVKRQRMPPINLSMQWKMKQNKAPKSYGSIDQKMSDEDNNNNSNNDGNKKTYIFPNSNNNQNTESHQPSAISLHHSSDGEIFRVFSFQFNNENYSTSKYEWMKYAFLFVSIHRNGWQ